MRARIGVVLLTLMFAACSGPGVEQLHEQILVIDAHADIEIPGKESVYAGADGRSEVAPDKMRAGGVDVVVMAAAVGPQPRNAEGYAAARARAEEEIAAIQRIVGESDNKVVLARSPDDLYAAQAGTQTSVCSPGWESTKCVWPLGRIQMPVCSAVRVSARLDILQHSCVALFGDPNAWV